VASLPDHVGGAGTNVRKTPCREMFRFATRQRECAEVNADYNDRIDAAKRTWCETHPGMSSTTATAARSVVVNAVAHVDFGTSNRSRPREFIVEGRHPGGRRCLKQRGSIVESACGDEVADVVARSAPRRRSWAAFSSARVEARPAVERCATAS